MSDAAMQTALKKANKRGELDARGAVHSFSERIVNGREYRLLMTAGA